MRIRRQVNSPVASRVRPLLLAGSIVSVSMMFVVNSLFSSTLADGTSDARSSQARAESDSKTFTLEKKFVVQPGGQLRVDVDSGQVEVITSEQNVVTIEVMRTIAAKYLNDSDEILKHHLVETSQDGPNVTVTGQIDPMKNANVQVTGLDIDVSKDVRQALKNALRRRLRAVRYRIKVPQRYEVDLKTSGGGISVADIAGNVHCQTSGGNLQLGQVNGTVSATTSGGSIHLKGSRGPAELRTSGGSIDAGNVGGSVVAHTSGGSIHLGKISGAASAKTSGGSISIAIADGPVEATTSGGSISATISKQPTADCRFDTSGGSIDIALSKTLSLNIEAIGGNGRVNGPFFSNNSTKNKTKNVQRAKLNGGGSNLIARTSSGNIRFRYANETNGRSARTDHK